MNDSLPKEINCILSGIIYTWTGSNAQTGYFTNEEVDIATTFIERQKIYFQLTNTPAGNDLSATENSQRGGCCGIYSTHTRQSQCRVLDCFFEEDSRSVGVVTVIKRDYLDHHDIGFAFLLTKRRKDMPWNKFRGGSVFVTQILFFRYSGKPLFRRWKKSIALLKKLGLDFIGEIEVENEVLHVYGASRDQIQLSLLTNEFYSVFRTKNGEKKSGCRKLTRLCVNEVSIRHKTKDHSVYFSLSRIHSLRKEILERGNLTNLKNTKSGRTHRCFPILLKGTFSISKIRSEVGKCILEQREINCSNLSVQMMAGK